LLINIFYLFVVAVGIFGYYSILAGNIRVVTFQIEQASVERNGVK